MNWATRNGIKKGRWARVRRRVLVRDRFRCKLCGKAGRMEIDHIVPLHVDPEQDPYRLDGLQSACRACHLDKTSRENRRPMTAAQEGWRRLVADMMEGQRP